MKMRSSYVALRPVNPPTLSLYPLLLLLPLRSPLFPQVTGAGCRGCRCRLQNSHPQPTLTRSAGYANPLRVRHWGHGFPFFDISNICLLHRCAIQTSCRCKLLRFFCSSTSVNCRSKQVLHINQRDFSQSTNSLNCSFNKVFRIMNFLVSDPQHIPFKPIK